jgi:RTX calcium-binding nonapeptide repeat (4 copies)
MPSYTIASYDPAGQSLSQAQLLAWSTATVASIGTTSILLRVRDGGVTGLPGDYDIRIGGTFTIQGGVLTGGTVTSITGRVADLATTLSSITGLSVSLQSLITSTSPPTFSNPSLSTLFGGVDTLTGGALADTLSGSGGVDTINGNGGNDIIRGGVGADILNGGTGDDIFVYLSGEAIAGETINGGDNSDAIDVFLDSDFSSASISNVETLHFKKPTGSLTVTLNSTQVGVHPSDKISFVDGSAAIDHLVINAVNGESFGTRDIQFSNWSTSDTINSTQFVTNDLRGSLQKETINGADQEDTIRGGGGADILNGGASNDAFRFDDSTQVVAGLQINGGTQIDKIALDAGIIYDFSQVVLNSVERLEFFGLGQTVTLLASQIGPGKISEFVGLVGSFVTINVVEANSTDLSTAILTGFEIFDRK